MVGNLKQGLALQPLSWWIHPPLVIANKVLMEHSHTHQWWIAHELTDPKLSSDSGDSKAENTSWPFTEKWDPLISALKDV